MHKCLGAFERLLHVVVDVVVVVLLFTCLVIFEDLVCQAFLGVSEKHDDDYDNNDYGDEDDIGDDDYNDDDHGDNDMTIRKMIMVMVFCKLFNRLDTLRTWSFSMCLQV